MSLILTLDQAHMMVALGAQSTYELLEVVENTKKEYQQNMTESRETITSQAERIKELEAALTSERAAHQDVQSVNRTLKGRLDVTIRENKELLDKVAYLQRGINALSLEWAEHKKWREEYYDIIGGLLGWIGFSRDAALAKCRKHGF